MNVVVVHNPRSGSAPQQKELAAMFKRAGIAVDAYLDITDQFQKKSIKTYAKQGRIIASIGGDGTIANTAQYIIGTSGILAPLPGGTLNHFTKDAGIIQDLPQAIAALPTAQKRTVDVATINDRVFLNNSSIGIYPSSLKVRQRIEDKLGKWPAAVIGSIRAFLRFTLYTVTIDGQTIQTPFLFVGNNDYHVDTGGERTSLTNGKLSLYAIASRSRLSVFKLIMAAVVRKLPQQPEFISIHSRQVTIHTKRVRNISVSTDGEVVRVATPLHYSCLPGGLTII